MLALGSLPIPRFGSFLLTQSTIPPKVTSKRNSNYWHFSQILHRGEICGNFQRRRRVELRQQPTASALNLLSIFPPAYLSSPTTSSPPSTLILPTLPSLPAQTFCIFYKFGF